MAFLIDEKRCTSPTSSAQVNAVIGPTRSYGRNQKIEASAVRANRPVRIEFGGGGNYEVLPDRRRQRAEPKENGGIPA
jgi:hypothetical protein